MCIVYILLNSSHTEASDGKLMKGPQRVKYITNKTCIKCLLTFKQIKFYAISLKTLTEVWLKFLNDPRMIIYLII